MEIHAPQYDKHGYDCHSKKFIQLRELFKGTVKGRNFFTPSLLGYVEIPNGVIEVSKGKIPFQSVSGDFYGITVVINSEYKKDISTSVNSLDEVKQYIESL